MCYSWSCWYLANLIILHKRKTYSSNKVLHVILQKRSPPSSTTPKLKRTNSKPQGQSKPDTSRKEGSNESSAERQRLEAPDTASPLPTPPVASSKSLVTQEEGSKPKGKGKSKPSASKKKLRKDKAKMTEKSDPPSSTDNSPDEKDSKKQNSNSLNRYTFTQITDEEKESHNKKERTQSCSSIPYDDIIHNLAVFRKSFDNVHFVHDDSLSIVPLDSVDDNILVLPEGNSKAVRSFAVTFVNDILDSAAKAIKMQEAASEKPDARLKCETSTVISNLFVPIITHTPSTDTLMDARSFVEEYEEYHDSCSEIPDSTTVATAIMSDIAKKVDGLLVDKDSKPKKKKDKSVKLGDARCIPLEMDSNAEDDSDFPQNDMSMQLVPYDAKFNLPKKIFTTMNNTEMVEITDQNIDILHQNVEIAENNPDMIEQPVLNVFKMQESKEYPVEDEDDMYKPIAVSPCGRFFKYEEEVNK